MIRYQGRQMAPFEFTPSTRHDWIKQAECARNGIAHMFPDPSEKKKIDYAKSICAVCPVREQCLDAALAASEPSGIWGGKTAEERQRMKRRTERARQTSREKAARAAGATDVAVGGGRL